MARAIGGLEIASSYLTPSAATLTALLDFNLSEREAIEIFWIQGLFSTIVDASLAVGVQYNAMNTLHMETGSLDDPLDADGDDEVRISTEILFKQTLNVTQHQATNQGLDGVIITPSEPVSYVDGKGNGLLSVINLTHRAEIPTTDVRIHMEIRMLYRKVKITPAEAVRLLTRRR